MKSLVIQDGWLKLFYLTLVTNCLSGHHAQCFGGLDICLVRGPGAATRVTARWLHGDCTGPGTDGDLRGPLELWYDFRPKVRVSKCRVTRTHAEPVVLTPFEGPPRIWVRPVVSGLCLRGRTLQRDPSLVIRDWGVISVGLLLSVALHHLPRDGLHEEPT